METEPSNKNGFGRWLLRRVLGDRRFEGAHGGCPALVGPPPEGNARVAAAAPTDDRHILRFSSI